MPDYEPEFTLSPGWEQSVVDASMGALESLGDQVAADAYRLCPVDTGHLRDSIYWNVDPDTGVITLGDSADYALYVEMGHRVAHHTHLPIPVGGMHPDARARGGTPTYWVPPQSFLRAALYRARGRA